MYNRKEKEREFFAYHADIFSLLKVPSPNFVLKTAFFQTGKYGRHIQLFEGELSKNEDLYIEFVDIIRDDEGKETNLIPMSNDRQLFKFKANPFYAEEYEVKENSKYSAYTIPASELFAVLKDGSEISYSLYEKRKAELAKEENSLPKLQKTLSVFPDFDEEFTPSKEKESLSKDDLTKKVLLEFAYNLQDITAELVKQLEKTL